MPLSNFIKRLVFKKIQRFLSKIWFQGILTSYDFACGRKIILFHISLAGQAAYILPILQQLRKRKEKVSVYLVVDQGLNLKISTLSSIVGINRLRILRWNECSFLGKINAFITPTQWIPNQPNSMLRICIFHGQPTKGNTFLPELIRHFNVLFLLGPLQCSLYDQFVKEHPKFGKSIKAFHVGYPKSDALINSKFSRSNILAELDLKADQPVVLFAPAFDQGTSLDMYGEQVFEKLLEIKANILVKLHPMCYDPRYYPSGINWTDRLRKFERYSNFRHLGNQPLEPFLASSDVLVTDTSGAALEFIMLDKPVIFIDCPDFFKKTLGQSQYVHSSENVLNDVRMNAGRNAGIVVPEPSQIPSAITRSLQFPEEFSLQREALRCQLLYNPGKAAEIATDALLKLVFRKTPDTSY